LDSGSTPGDFFPAALPAEGAGLASAFSAGADPAAGAGAGSDPPQPETRMAMQDAKRNDTANFLMIDFNDPER
jgi:hypothetical protein